MDRYAKLREYLKTNKLDGVLIYNPANVFYYSNFSGTSGCLLMTLEENYLITDFRYVSQATSQSKGFEIVETTTENTIDKVVNKLRRKHELYKLGLEGDFITRNQWLNFEKKLTSRLISVNIDHIRQVKDSGEVELIKEAIAIAEAAFTDTLSKIRVGMSEKEVARMLEFKMLELGAEGIAFDTIVASGVRGALPHGVASDKLIQNNELITIDYGCIYKGYCSDITRTFGIGKIDEKLLEMYDIVKKANELGIESVKAGVSAYHVDKVVRDFITSKGYGDYFGHGLGHSLGIEVHENPRLNQISKDNLEVGNIVTIEPGIYIEGLGGIRIEDDILIKADTVEVLTSLNKQLIILEEEV